MIRRSLLTLGLTLLAAGVALAPERRADAQAQAVTVYRGARVIVGDGRPAIDDAAFVVRGDRFVAIGSSATVDTPPGATSVDLRGRTVMPAIIDAHSHIGYMKDLTTGPENYTRENILDHMQKFAYHGVAASQAQGSDFGVMPFAVRDEILAGKHPDAARFLTAGRGLAPPDEISPDNMRHAAYVVTTEQGARANVQELAHWRVRLLKIWLTARDGGVKPFAPNIVQAIVGEAHALGLRVIVHATEIENAKIALRAGVDALAHMITDVDEELIELLKARPHVTVLLAQVGRRTIHAPYLDPPDPLLAETVTPAQIARLRDAIANTSPEERARARADWDKTAHNILRLHTAGVKIGIGSDGGGQGRDRYIGFTAHTELENMVAAGMKPIDAIVAGTNNGAELLGLGAELGTIETGKSADFIVLAANPLDDITNTRKIADVYLRGHRVDRARLRARWAAEMHAGN
jgi:imidazolonepropionase-like amidohydrolase